MTVSKIYCTFVRMFERLQTKWKVNGTQLFLVICVFALGGSATGWLGKIIMNWMSIDQKWIWTLAYIIIVTLIWPAAVLLVSIPFGQFSFFTQYLKRMGSRMGVIGKNTEYRIQDTEYRTKHPESSIHHPVNIAILASGTGTNAQKIIDHFRNHNSVKISLIGCNKPEAGVLAIATTEKIPILMIKKENFFRGGAYVQELRNAGIDVIILAGFLWKIPQQLIDAYRNKIINIHPALLPKYGGKGMYGSRVHEAVLHSGEKESGITIHYVDEHYDNGDIIFQARVNISDNETPETLAEKIHYLEHLHYPEVIEQLILVPNGS